MGFAHLVGMTEWAHYVIPTEMSETNGMERISLMKEIHSTAPDGFARYDKEKRWDSIATLAMTKPLRIAS